MVKLVGEGEDTSDFTAGDNFSFLKSLGIVENGISNELTPIGRALFEAAFIRVSSAEEIEILKGLLLDFPPVQAIQQYLWGLKDVKTDQVLTVLKSTGYWFYCDISPLTHFLEILNFSRIISYARKEKKIKVLIPPDSPKTPRCIFIDPSRPFSNTMWIKRVLGECSEFIYWIDKHFQKEALEWLWGIADASKIKEIKIISLDLGEGNLNGEAKKNYKNLRQELANKGISLSWLTIDSKKIRDSHDRWIIGGKLYARNVPNVGAIVSGQRSEITLTDNYEDVLKAFNGYLKLSEEVIV
jgi:hypothetical protein